MSCQIVVCCNHKGSFISIINTRYASNATSERGTQTGIDPATFETEGKSRNHSATTRWSKRTTTLTTNVDSNAQRKDVDNFKIDDLQYNHCVNVKKAYYDYGDAD